MTVYPNVRARYTKGVLKLRKPLNLAEGTEVQVTVTPVEAATASRTRGRGGRTYTYPTRTVSWDSLKAITGIMSVGGDAVADAEALYDED
jgi:predicted DNA-binding antitoxin AbrB/MazE fold protein